ncbi:MAG TPA: hypothetical protein VJR06_01220 [Nitrososphaerales archaeon]|nr:hypothetical protein [Nitrososphaerales archaeon]
MSSTNPLTVSGIVGIGQGTVDVTLPGNFFNYPMDNPPNIDPVPGIVFLQGGTTVFGTDQAGNVVAKNRNIDGSLPT